MSELKYDQMWELADRHGIEFDHVRYADLRCVLCLGIVRQAMQSECGCRFCRQCLVRYIDSDEKWCPGPTDECRAQRVQLRNSARPDSSANRDVSEMLVRCPLGGCGARCRLIDVGRHLESHRTCAFSAIGCSVPVVANGDGKGGGALESHYSDEQIGHMALVVARLVALGTEHATNQYSVAAALEDKVAVLHRHVDEALDKLTDSRRCHDDEEEARRTSEEREHRHQQLHQKIDSISSELSSITLREAINATEIDKVKVELSAIDQKQDKFVAEQQQQHRSILANSEAISDLRARVGRLEAELVDIREMQRQNRDRIDEVAASNSAMIERVREDLIEVTGNHIDKQIRRVFEWHWHRAAHKHDTDWASEHEHERGPRTKKIKGASSPVGATAAVGKTETDPISSYELALSKPQLRPLKSDSQELQYVIDGFSSHRRNDAALFTEPFSSADGYRFCLAVHPNGVGEGAGSHLSLQLVAVPSDGDERLVWPRQHTFLVSLLDQQTENPVFCKPCIELAWLVDRPPPLGRVNAHRSLTRFCRLKTLLASEKHLRNDSIVLVLSVSVS